MKAGFSVRYTEGAQQDLNRLFEYRLEQARSVEDFDAAQRTIDTIRAEIEGRLPLNPFLCRKAGASPFLRELLIPCGSSGYVALYEIRDGAHIDILAIRHQLEDDYH